MGSLTVIKDGHSVVIKNNNSEPSSVSRKRPVSVFLQEVLPKDNYRLGKVDKDEYSGVNFVFFRKKKLNLPLGWLSTRDREDYIELWVFRSAESITYYITEILEKYSREFDCEVNLSVLQNY